MSEITDNSNEAPERDDWLSAVFAAAAGPVIDMAFVDRVLARMRKRQRVRSFVIFGTVVFAGALTLWQLSGLAATLPVMEVATLSVPAWLAGNTYMTAALALALVGLTAWMITEEA